MLFRSWEAVNAQREHHPCATELHLTLGNGKLLGTPLSAALAERIGCMQGWAVFLKSEQNDCLNHRLSIFVCIKPNNFFITLFVVRRTMVRVLVTRERLVPTDDPA